MSATSAADQSGESRAAVESRFVDQLEALLLAKGKKSLYSLVSMEPQADSNERGIGKRRVELLIEAKTTPMLASLNPAQLEMVERVLGLSADECDRLRLALIADSVRSFLQERKKRLDAADDAADDATTDAAEAARLLYSFLLDNIDEERIHQVLAHTKGDVTFAPAPQAGAEPPTTVIIPVITMQTQATAWRLLAAQMSDAQTSRRYQQYAQQTLGFARTAVKAALAHYPDSEALADLQQEIIADLDRPLGQH